MVPLYLKDAVLTIAATGYEAEVSAVTLTPSTSVATWKGLTPEAVFTESGIATWVADLTFGQDWDDPTSLGVYLFEHEGEVAAAVFTPKNGGGGFAVNLIATPGAIGGTVDGFAESSVSLPIQGRPVYTPPVLAFAAPAVDDD